MIEPNGFNVNIITDDEQPGTSDRKTSAEKTKQFIQEAKASKARMYGTPGKQLMSRVNDMFDQFLNSMWVQQVNTQQHSAMVDENYLVIGANVEKGLVEKIINNEYVDFARLLPKDRAVLRDKDH